MMHGTGPKKTLLISLVVIALAATAPWAAAAPFFQGLGDLPGGSFNSAALAVSADGAVVVGLGDGGCEAFRWTLAGGMVGLGHLPVGNFGNYATAVSANGAVIVGNTGSSAATPGFCEAFRWTQAGGMVGLGDLPGGIFHSEASGVSADGSVVVGHSKSGPYDQAFRWTQVGGMVGLGALPGGAPDSYAFGVSADGSVVVGTSDSGLGAQAYRWTQAGGMVGLGDLPGGVFQSYALGVSAGGSVVVGFGTSGSGLEAFRWTQAGGMVGLGDLPSPSFYSIAYAVSADASVVVGNTNSASGAEAFRWTEAAGMRRLQDVLASDYGLSLTGWTLREARGVSADGKVIGGWGQNPSGQNEAWIANLRTHEERLLSGVPEYAWRRGCSPTSGAMLVAYWDQQYENLWAGRPPASNNPFDDSDPVNVVIEHIGDLMGTTVSGGTDPARVPAGLVQYAREKEYSFAAGNRYVSDGTFTFDFLKGEIDAGRALHLGVGLDVGYDAAHSILLYGYQDNPGSGDDWVAVRDTWLDGDSSGSGGIVAKIENGVEWWKWVTDRSGAYHIYRGCWFTPAGVLPVGFAFGGSTFSNAEDFAEAFRVDRGSGMGTAEIVSSPLGIGNDVLKFSQPDPSSFVAIEFETFVAELTRFSFDYLFDTEGKLKVTLDDIFLIELACPDSGPGSIGADAFASFSGVFAMSGLGLDTNEVRTWRIELSGMGDPVAYIDNLWVSKGVPEPASLLLLLGGLAALARRRRARAA